MILKEKKIWRIKVSPIPIFPLTYMPHVSYERERFDHVPFCPQQPLGKAIIIFIGLRLQWFVWLIHKSGYCSVSTSSAIPLVLFVEVPCFAKSGTLDVSGWMFDMKERKIDPLLVLYLWRCILNFFFTTVFSIDVVNIYKWGENSISE